MSAEQKSYPSQLEKVKAITDQLEAGIQSLFESEKFKQYLKTLSKFHNYSLNNTLLIANVGVAANAAVATSKDTLGNDIRDMLKNVVTNDASVSDNIGKANELHALLNKGASDIDANLTVSAVL